MSDVQKPVEETPAATPAAAPAAETPAATETPATEAPAAETTQETPAETTEAAPAAENTEAPAEEPKEDKKEEAKEVTPATEGVLGYKGPGLVKGLRFAKRFFYFNDEAVEAKQLSVFQQNEKPAVANPTVAWATQTGKGLLFLTKRAEDKATPAGVFNLAEVADITKDGSNEVLFKVNGQKHTFQAANAGERDSWFAALEAKAAEAKAEKETIVASEGYKAELEKLTNPAAAEKKEKAAEPKEEAKEEAKDEAAPAEEPKDKATAKSRSQSRKRTSIFGTLLGKKEEAEEKKEEDKPAEEAKPAEATTETTAEAAPAAESSAEAAAPAETTENKEEQKEEKKEEAKEEKKEEKTEKAEKAQKSKRASLFGGFFQKVTSPSQEKTEKEATAPAETPVASTAPQLENPVEEAAVKPIEPESVTAPAEGEAAKDAAAPAETPATETTAAATKEKRRTSLFFGKKKAGESDNEAEGEAKPKGNKLGGLFRRSSKAVKLDKEEAPAADAEAKADKPEPISKDAPVEEAPAAEEAAQPAEAPATEEAKPANVASTSTPVQAAA
ncbi:hypothetical protein ASPWEDRAFT_22657 [Aspergillus wentii DTO 134E9]|uniref:PH domain-containing protein n=1 Tax=Aspergillus wentii DTO 134E9 TaxID=1073089 RepID=A0A1L9S059_ASPWE|nr:uncharacterized protein ASPWEDRAFT_22657 [Aspergillus wentii DTO 134E9]KAI9932903.1 hypothetical protein MW887_009155 [Aspergillus wentii]OJJ40487.1 hypothetical protein ASPWEDRAFT_22657 [Aspergillus wentii DTO 134E9]